MRLDGIPRGLTACLPSPQHAPVPDKPGGIQESDDVFCNNLICPTISGSSGAASPAPGRSRMYGFTSALAGEGRLAGEHEKRDTSCEETAIRSEPGLRPPAGRPVSGSSLFSGDPVHCRCKAPPSSSVLPVNSMSGNPDGCPSFSIPDAPSGAASRPAQS